MRLGILGGSFDPVHFGHLVLAELCREGCGLDQVWFVPASSPPHKQHRALAADSHRVEMLELAIAGNDAFRVSRMEVERGGVSYTVDTLRQVRQMRPGDELFLLMGADSLSDVPTWVEPEEICRLATLVVGNRPLAPPVHPEVLRRILPDDAPGPEIIVMPDVGFSSSEVRRRVAAGRSIRYWTPRAVQKYMETHRLYQATAQ